MAIFEKTLLTRKGHQLLSKVLAGKTDMLLTKVQAGDGNFDYDTADVLDLTGLVSPRLDGRIISVTPTGKYSSLVGLITNEKLTAFMEFRELGVFAKDPDAGEILFAYANAGDFADPIGPYNGVYLHEESITINIYTANIAEIYATITPSAYAVEVTYDNKKSGMAAETVQAALDELASSNVLGVIFTHNLGTYPTVTAMEIRYGVGMGGCGETPCGGDTELTELRCQATHLNSNQLKIALNKKYTGTPTVIKALDGVFTVVYPDMVLRIALQVDYSSMVIKMMAMEANFNQTVAALRSEVNSINSTGNTQITVLSAKVDSNQAATDGKVTALRTDLTAAESDISSIETTVRQNKESADTRIKTLQQNIYDVPTGCGN